MKLENGREIDFVDKSTIQHESEVKAMLDCILRGSLSLKDAIEIGVWEGGTTHVWAQVITGRVFAIDVHFGTDTPSFLGSPAANFVEPVYRKTQVADKVVEIDGRCEDQKTIDLVSHLLCGEKVNFLFHDGDHSYEAVKRDVEIYSQFVAPGGWIAVHDFANPTHGVGRFWEEFKVGRESWEFVIQRQPEKQRKSHRDLGFVNGIGLIRWEGR